MKNNPFPTQPSYGRRIVEQRASRSHMCPAVRIGLSRLFFSSAATKANKNQQLAAGDFGRGNKDQQKSTQFNGVSKVSKSQQNQPRSTSAVSKNHQKSSKIIRNHHRPRSQSSKIINSHQKSSLFALVCKRVQSSSEQTAAIGT